MVNNKNKLDDLDEDEQKILFAMFILCKGDLDTGVPESEVFSLCESMSLAELKRNAKKINDKVKSL